MDRSSIVGIACKANETYGTLDAVVVVLKPILHLLRQQGRFMLAAMPYMNALAHVADRIG